MKLHLDLQYQKKKNILVQFAPIDRWAVEKNRSDGGLTWPLSSRWNTMSLYKKNPVKSGELFMQSDDPTDSTDSLALSPSLGSY